MTLWCGLVTLLILDAKDQHKGSPLYPTSAGALHLTGVINKSSVGYLRLVVERIETIKNRHTRPKLET